MGGGGTGRGRGGGEGGRGEETWTESVIWLRSAFVQFEAIGETDATFAFESSLAKHFLSKRFSTSLIEFINWNYYYLF